MAIDVNLEITQTTGIDAPLSVGIERNYPNPFNPSTAFRYTVPDPGAFVRISIFDLQGRVVRTLESEEKWAGEHTAVWSGRDDSGKSLGSGVYFYRIEIGQHHVTRKMVLMR